MIRKLLMLCVCVCSMNLAIYARKTGYTVNPLCPPVG